MEETLLEELLGLPEGSLEEHPPADPKVTTEGFDEEVFNHVVDMSANLWQNMSEEHRRKSMACTEHLRRSVELERLRLKARILGIKVEAEPENAREITAEEFDNVAEEILRKIDETDRLLNAPEKGGGQ